MVCWDLVQLEFPMFCAERDDASVSVPTCPIPTEFDGIMFPESKNMLEHDETPVGVPMFPMDYSMPSVYRTNPSEQSEPLLGLAAGEDNGLIGSPALTPHMHHSLIRVIAHFIFKYHQRLTDPNPCSGTISAIANRLSRVTCLLVPNRPFLSRRLREATFIDLPSRHHSIVQGSIAEGIRARRPIPHNHRIESPGLHSRDAEALQENQGHRTDHALFDEILDAEAAIR
jgi:hypothetical protein